MTRHEMLAAMSQAAAEAAVDLETAAGTPPSEAMAAAALALRALVVACEHQAMLARIAEQTRRRQPPLDTDSGGPAE